MTGSCDCCDRTKVPISRGEVTGIETYACFICQGEADPDPYGEMETQMTPTLYIITFSTMAPFTLRTHTGTYEMDMDRMTLANIADDVLSGQYPDVRRVIEATPGQDCADVTEDVAMIVARRVREEGHVVSHGLKTWLHQVLGIESTRGMVDA